MTPKHRIEEVDFSEGRALCTCLHLIEVAADPLFDRDNSLASAWLEHRRLSGQRIDHEIGYDRDGTAQVFRLHRR